MTVEKCQSETTDAFGNCQSETTDAFGNCQSKGKMMRTLEEVIKALRCTNPETDPETKCEDCPYKELHELHINELWYVGPSCLDEMFADALHYLKEYQTLQYGYIKAMADLEDNPPLTWSELKLMEGKPVWLESKRYGARWYLLENVYHDSLDCIGIYEERVSYDRNDDDWQCYRKERKFE